MIFFASPMRFLYPRRHILSHKTSRNTLRRREHGGFCHFWAKNCSPASLPLRFPDTLHKKTAAGTYAGFAAASIFAGKCAAGHFYGLVNRRNRREIKYRFRSAVRVFRLG
jgi:hypothetical protein